MKNDAKMTPLPAEVPENAIFDVPPQVFENESSWNREIYKEFIESKNPELAEKMKKLQKLARKLKSKSVKTRKNNARRVTK